MPLARFVAPVEAVKHVGQFSGIHARAAVLHAQLDAATLVQFDILLNTMLLWEADQLGQTDADSWEATQTVLIEAGLLDAAIPLDGAYSNAFIRE